MTLRASLTLQRSGFALNCDNLCISTQGITVIYGPSGAGKTTLLRAIAGLENHASGTVYFRDKCWQGNNIFVPTAQRNVGFVFQDAALFPHLSVRGNLNYALKRCPQGQPSQLQSTAHRVGLEGLLERPISVLSGGEKQRVAIARALLSCPQLLCMDEPLSALDWSSRNELLTLIESLAHETKIPVLYVTHTPREVERLASRIVFMQNGSIARCESLQDALANPHSPLFDEEGPLCVLEGITQYDEEDALLVFRTEGGVRLRMATNTHTTRSQTRLRILARDVSIALNEPEGISILNQLPSTIHALTPQGDGRILVHLRLSDGQILYSQITAFSANRLKLQAGQSVFALVKSVALID